METPFLPTSLICYVLYFPLPPTPHTHTITFLTVAPPSPSSQENIKSEIVLLLCLLLLSMAHLIGVQQPRNTCFSNTFGGLGPLRP